MTRTGRREKRYSTREGREYYESNMEFAVEDLDDGKYRTVKEAATAWGPGGEQVTQNLGRPNVASQVAYSTLYGRVNGTHKARNEAYKHLWLLDEDEENLVNEWLDLYSDTATPRELRAYVLELTGKLPGKRWHQNHLKRHNKTLKPRRRHPKW